MGCGSSYNKVYSYADNDDSELALIGLHLEQINSFYLAFKIIDKKSIGWIPAASIYRAADTSMTY